MLADKRILVVEDDLHVCEVIKATLKRENAIVQLIHQGDTGLQAARDGHIDLVILDIMLPGLGGLEICRCLREEHFTKPIIMLTAKADEVDRVLGLELGADDYITKPFSPRELVARCKAALRLLARQEQLPEQPCTIGDLTINKDQYQAFVHGEPLPLTPKEFQLLSFLADHPEHTFTRHQLLDQVWGFESQALSRTVDEHIKRLRQKLRHQHCTGVSIATVWGVGYQLKALSDHG